MAILIDTSILIAIERGQLDLAASTAGREDMEIFLSVIGASELLRGAYRAADAAMRARRLAFVEGLLARFPLAEIDLEVARAHAELWSTLAQKGQIIGMNDSWIAATCIARDLTLATANLREFERVPGLQVENWLAG
ncbi:MAG: PIN domain-containing protein [Nitrososphaerales archaeon]